MKAEIYSFKIWIKNTEAKVLYKAIEFALENAQFEVLGFLEHEFTPTGYTAVWLLGESHLAIHTFPEENKTYLELSSCNAQKNETFKAVLFSSDLRMET